MPTEKGNMWLEVSPEHVLEIKGTLCLEHSLERFPAAGDMLRGGLRTSETMSKPFLYNLAGFPGLCPRHRHYGHSFGPVCSRGRDPLPQQETQEELPVNG